MNYLCIVYLYTAKVGRAVYKQVITLWETRLMPAMVCKPPKFSRNKSKYNDNFFLKFYINFLPIMVVPTFHTS